MDGVVEAASAQKSFIAFLFITVTDFLCFLYLDQFKSVGTRRNLCTVDFVFESAFEFRGSSTAIGCCEAVFVSRVFDEDLFE